MPLRFQVDEQKFAEQLKEVEEEIRKEDAGEKKPPRATTERIMWVSLAGIFVFIFIVYAILGPVEHQVIGQLNSQEITTNTLHLKGITIHFENNTHDVLQELYSDKQLTELVETSVCLQGSIKDNSKQYIVNDIFYPTIYDEQRTHVSFSPCPEGTIIMLHTHPQLQCLASETDIKTLKKSKERLEKDVLMMIICNENRYALYK